MESGSIHPIKPRKYTPLRAAHDEETLQVEQHLTPEGREQLLVLCACWHTTVDNSVRGLFSKNPTPLRATITKKKSCYDCQMFAVAATYAFRTCTPSAGRVIYGWSCHYPSEGCWQEKRSASWFSTPGIYIVLMVDMENGQGVVWPQENMPSSQVWKDVLESEEHRLLRSCFATLLTMLQWVLLIYKINFKNYNMWKAINLSYKENLGYFITND